METPVQISFRDVPASDEVERLCRAEADKLERYHGRITGCHVRVSRPHLRHRKGNLYNVRVDLVIPGSELVVDRTPTEHASDETLELAVREAFDSARRRLEDAVRRMRGDVKTHAAPAHGRVSQVDGFRGFGTLTTPDGRELYFHANSVLGASLDELEVGEEVAFHEEEGDHGPQASTVRPVGRHGHRLP